MRPYIGKPGFVCPGPIEKQGTNETGFEPAVAGYEPAAKPFSYSNLLFVPLALSRKGISGCLRIRTLLAGSGVMFKTQFFRFMRDSNPRPPGYEPGAPQLEQMDPEKIAVCVFL